MNHNLNPSKVEEQIMQLFNTEDISLDSKSYYDIVAEIIFANPLIAETYRKNCENNIFDEDDITVEVMHLFFLCGGNTYLTLCYLH